VVVRRTTGPLPPAQQGNLTHSPRNEPDSDALPAKGDPMPESIGRCADEYSSVRALRLAMEKIVEGVKARETEIQDHIINNLSASADTGASGLKYRAQIVKKDAVHIKDWAAFTNYILENDRFDLLQKRLSDKAALDLFADGVDVPGLEKMKVPKVSITKV
jgi:hypothetical protein